jgi:hypothetical protein
MRLSSWPESQSVHVELPADLQHTDATSVCMPGEDVLARDRFSGGEVSSLRSNFLVAGLADADGVWEHRWRSCQSCDVLPQQINMAESLQQ